MMLFSYDKHTENKCSVSSKSVKYKNMVEWWKVNLQDNKTAQANEKTSENVGLCVLVG